MEIKVLRARDCHICEKRRMVAHIAVTLHGYTRDKGNICTPCVLEILTALLTKGLHRERKHDHAKK